MPFHPGTTYTVVVKVVSVTVSKAVSMLVWTDVAVAVSVTVSVAASRDRYDEQKAAPTSGTSPSAATHVPLHGLIAHAPKAPATKPPRQSAESFIFDSGTFKRMNRLAMQT